MSSTNTTFSPTNSCKSHAEAVAVAEVAAAAQREAAECAAVAGVWRGAAEAARYALAEAVAAVHAVVAECASGEAAAVAA
jgi:hypothetical protein